MNTGRERDLTWIGILLISLLLATVADTTVGEEVPTECRTPVVVSVTIEELPVPEVAPPVPEVARPARPAWPGAGTSARPYRIATVAQLQAMRQALSAHFALVADIDASETAEWNGGAGFEPVGGSAAPFTGSFDGRGHSIRGLTINRFGRVTQHIGLFGFAGSNALIRNVSIEQALVKGCDHVGILVGANEGEIRYCHVSGEVQGSGSFGGMVGSNRRGILRKCSSAAEVRPIWVGNHLGGLAGINHEGVIADCFATGAVTGLENPGGLVGGNIGGVILRCYAVGDVKSTFGGVSDSYRRGVGGLVGSNQGGARIIDSFAAGMVVAPARVPAGSLAGICMDSAGIFNSHGVEHPDRPLPVTGRIYADAGLTLGAAFTEIGPDFFRKGPLESWNLSRVWNLDEAGAVYPRFKRQHETRRARPLAIKVEVHEVER